MCLLTGLPLLVLSAEVSHQCRCRHTFSIVVLRLSVTLAMVIHTNQWCGTGGSTCHTFQVLQAAQGMSTNPPCPPLWEAHCWWPQTTSDARSYFYGRNWGQWQEAGGKNIQLISKYKQMWTHSHRAMADILLGSDKAKAAGPALRMSRKTSCSLNICVLFLVALCINLFVLRSQSTCQWEHTRCIQYNERNDLHCNKWHKPKSQEWDVRWREEWGDSLINQWDGGFPPASTCTRILLTCQ